MAVHPWPKAKVMRQALYLTLLLLLLGAASFMARRNLVLGRGDRRGAFRVSLLLCAIGIVAWALGAHNVADWNVQTGLVMRGAGHVVLQAGFVWLVYLAVEPYARRLRPWTLVAWTRFLGGGLADPVVGRDVLVGVAWAAAAYYLGPLRHTLATIVGQPPPEPSYGSLDTLLGTGELLSVTLSSASSSILLGLGCLLLFVLVRSVLRRDLLAVPAVVLVLLLPSALTLDASSVHGLPLLLAFTFTWVLVLLRFGLLAACVASFASELLYVFPITAELGSWKAGPTLFVLPLLALAALWGFRSAVGATGLRRYLAPDTPVTS